MRGEGFFALPHSSPPQGPPSRGARGTGTTEAFRPGCTGSARGPQRPRRTGSGLSPRGGRRRGRSGGRWEPARGAVAGKRGEPSRRRFRVWACPRLCRRAAGACSDTVGSRQWCTAHRGPVTWDGRSTKSTCSADRPAPPRQRKNVAGPLNGNCGTFGHAPTDAPLHGWAGGVSPSTSARGYGRQGEDRAGARGAPAGPRGARDKTLELVSGDARTGGKGAGR